MLLLPATIALFFNNQTNKHVHILPNGQIITHSHPFSKDSQDGKHTHTAKEFSLFAGVFNTFSSEAASFALSITLLFFVEIKHFEFIQTTSNPHSFYKANRAPPTKFNV